MTTTYEVWVTREDNLWVADVRGLPPHLIGATDVEHFADLDEEVRDLIAGLTDTEPDHFAIDWRYQVNGKDVTDKLARFLAVESELRERLAERDAARIDAVRQLTAAGLSQRAVGDVLGVSHQRVNQLVNS